MKTETLPPLDTTTVTMTTNQIKSLRIKFKQSRDGSHDFKEFCSRIYLEPVGDAVVLKWCGMWLCIEPDGYCHS